MTLFLSSFFNSDFGLILRAFHHEQLQYPEAVERTVEETSLFINASNSVEEIPNPVADVKQSFKSGSISTKDKKKKVNYFSVYSETIMWLSN